jgi:hypothetical protein
MARGGQPLVPDRGMNIWDGLKDNQIMDTDSTTRAGARVYCSQTGQCKVNGLHRMASIVFYGAELRKDEEKIKQVFSDN